jgi:hypothetical protein
MYIYRGYVAGKSKPSFQLEFFEKKHRGYTDAAGKPKSLVRKCFEINSDDEYYSNYWRNGTLYEELTGDSGVDQCFEEC